MKINYSLLINITIISLIAIVVRLCVGTFSYSGFIKPPMHGDFEAQRHWMEITLNLPIEEWYTNTTNNDLNYWGLDYPPLTAYHSLLCAHVANYINPKWVELFNSRGFESFDLKFFMRITVIIVDILIFFTGTFAFFRRYEEKQYLAASTLTLLYPGLILIDHGHFQYNCASLGLCLWACHLLWAGRDLYAAAMFAFSLGYKQMQLYHSLPFFGVLLGRCLRPWVERNCATSSIFRLSKVAVVTVGTAALYFGPFLWRKDTLLQVIHRIFPTGRGLFEDKVANVWCSMSVLIKLKQLISQALLLRMCIFVTLVACLPSTIHLICRPSYRRFSYAMVNCSLAFFLFSYQVHEKSILIVALPICLLLVEDNFYAIWFLFISTFSMLPLLIKDGLVLPYFALQIQFAVVSWYFNVDRLVYKVPSYVRYLRRLSVLGSVVLSVACLTLHAPPHLPDLAAVAISVYACVHFLAFLVYFNARQYSVDDQTGGRAKSKLS